MILLREPPSTTVTAQEGDAAADLFDAATRMLTAPSLSFTGTALKDREMEVTASGVVTAPNRVLIRITQPGSPQLERIFIGSDAYLKDPEDGKWETYHFPSPPGGTNPRDLFEALTHAAEVSRDGEHFLFALSSAVAQPLVGVTRAKAVVFRGELRVVDGYITEVAYTASSGPSRIEARLAFRDIGTAAPVIPPVVLG